MLVVVLVLENPDRFAIRLTEQISCRTSVSLRSRNPNASVPALAPATGANKIKRNICQSLREHRDLRASFSPSGILRRAAGERVSHGGHGADFSAIDQSLDAAANGPSWSAYSTGRKSRCRCSSPTISAR